MKHLKKITLSIAILSFIGLKAQENPNDKRELMDKMKLVYIQEKLELSQSEMENFTALVKKFEAEKRMIMQEKESSKGQFREMKEEEKIEKKLTEEEAKKMLHSRIEHQKKLIALEEEYIEKSCSAITAVKVLEYYKAEKEFKKELLMMLKDKNEVHLMRANHMKDRAKYAKEGREMKLKKEEEKLEKK